MVLKFVLFDMGAPRCLRRFAGVRCHRRGRSTRPSLEPAAYMGDRVIIYPELQIYLSIL